MLESSTMILSLPSTTNNPQIDIPLPSPYIQAQMEEYKVFLFDRLHNLVTERTIASDPIAYDEK